MTQTLVKAYLAAITPPPLMSIHEWAGRNLHLTSKETSRPGPYDPHVTPYLIEVLERLSPSDPCEFVYLMWGAQLGKSMGMNAALAYYMAHDPAPCLMMQPTVQLAETYSKQRIAPMIANSPALTAIIGDPKSRDGSNTLTLKEFPGGMLVMVGANAPTMMRSMPIKIAMFDEVDGYTASAGSDGNPVKLGTERTNAFPGRKILLTSTPGTKESSKIEAAYQTTGQRFYHVPCPHCGTMQRLEWERMQWKDDRHRTAYMDCISDDCTAPIYDRHKATMLPAGEWRAEFPELEEDGEAYGYHLSGLYAPLGWSPVSWPNIVRKFLAIADDPNSEVVFVNTTLAETYEEFSGEEFDQGGLMERAEVYAAPVPAGVAILTAGVDVQGWGVEVEIIGWGAGEESWSIDYKVILGDPTGAALWQDLESHLLQTWHHETAGPIGVTLAAIDSGFEASRVQDFCAKHRRRRWYAIRGVSGQGKPLWPKKGKRGKKGRGEMFYNVGIDNAKATNWRRLQRVESGPGCIHFPADRGLFWFEQLVSEAPRKVYVKNRPRTEWVRRGSVRAEALDCRVYGYCVLHSFLNSRRTLEALHAALPKLTPVAAARAAETARPIAGPTKQQATQRQRPRAKPKGFKPRF